MGLGILEDHKLEHVPGTAYVLNDESRRVEEGLTADHNLKCDNSGPVPIILVPQPSDDPNDPLNWPLWRRDLILFVLSLQAVIAASLSPILAADTLKLALFYRRTFTDVALLTGWHLLGVGVAGFIFVPSSRVWGKRHAFLIGNIFLIFSSAWAGASGHNYKSMLAARTFQGIGLAPFESLVNPVVGDMYFVHERGKRMALTNFAVFGGAFLTPVVVGKMSHTIGWPWTFYLVAILSAAMLPALVFFVPETAFRRDERLNTDVSTKMEGHRLSVLKETAQERSFHADDRTPRTSDARTTESAHLPRKATYRESLKPFNGRKTDENYWKLLLRPLPLFFHPGILWACLTQGTLIGWTVFLGIILSAIMLAPPLFFDEVSTGYMYTGAFIGAVVGLIVAGLSADFSARWLSKRNRGVFEPEFRLILIIPQLILGCAGLYGFGITANNTYKYHWFWPDFFFALEVAAMVIGAVASSLYVVDAHRNIAIEGFTCMMVFKNIFSFGLTFHGYNWLVQGGINGIRNVFTAVGSVQVVICLLTIPMYIFGKRNRSFFARHDILKISGLW
ncbi:MFS transporter [Trichodelitschia bisporula]|uniref:MFS transporter n=1 Tax=Trichodelitschia bisporula TaxID=703511 RepID=A0A6G1IBS5_9PEZI|nr:MFS transporter [Trichodelitschia bisporula]